MILMIHMIDTDNIVGHIFGANFGQVPRTRGLNNNILVWYMILMIHMIDTDNIVGHIFGANFGQVQGAQQ